MTASGTYNFNPSLGECTLFAFNLCGVRPAALTQEHFQSARMAANLLLSEWSAEAGVNLWQVVLQTIDLVQGQATYEVPYNSIVMLDAYIETIDGSGNAIDRIILPISRTEYASYPAKSQQGFPTVFWNDRLINGTVTLWPVPDGTQTSLKYYMISQIDDANLTNGQNINLPVYYYKAFCYGLGYHLADVWAPDKAMALKARADEAYAKANLQNIENSDFFVSPQVASYFRP